MVSGNRCRLCAFGGDLLSGPLSAMGTHVATVCAYLRAVFTATRIVAAISAAPNTAAHLPGIDTAQVRLSAADSEIVSKMGTFRIAEVRTVTALVNRAATVVGDHSARPRADVAEGHPLSSAQPLALALNAAGIDTPSSAVRTNAHHSAALAHVSAPPIRHCPSTRPPPPC